MLLITNLETTTSTNTYMHDLVNNKKTITNDLITIDVPEFYTVSSNFQTEGKGQKNNSWHSEPGKNMLLSTVVYPKDKGEDQFNVNMKICLGILDYCKSNIAEEGFSIKWPNDIYYHDKKIGGLLIEHSIIGESILYTIIGIGLNINQTEFPEDLPNPISAAQICNYNFNLDECVRELLLNLSEKKKYYNKHPDLLKKDYLSSLYRYKTWSKFQIKNETLTASIEDVNKYGMLCLKDEANIKHECGFKEVSYII